MAGTSRMEVLHFDCDGDRLAGVLHRPAAMRSTGVVVVVGGPQYRIGAHRQFVSLARHLAEAGFAVLRFDYRGAGDSEGAPQGFTMLDPDISAAIAALQGACPEVRQVVLWGLCDGATAAALHAASHPEVAGLMLVNPWVRTSSGHARAQVRHYYLRRLLRAEFWRGILSGRTPAWPALRGFLSDLRQALRRANASVGGQPALVTDDPRLPASMRDALLGSRAPALLVLSGNDLTAREFSDWLESREWAQLRKRPGLSRVDLPAADHTFSRRAWQSELNRHCREWLERHDP